MAGGLCKHSLGPGLLPVRPVPSWPPTAILLWHCLSLPHLERPQKPPRLALALGVLQQRLGLWPHWRELHLPSSPVWLTVAPGSAPSAPLTQSFLSHLLAKAAPPHLPQTQNKICNCRGWRIAGRSPNPLEGPVVGSWQVRAATLCPSRFQLQAAATSLTCSRRGLS